MQASDTPSIIVRDLACRRGDRLLFRRLSFELRAGEACHLTGANGVGKTTLIRALAGLTAPYAGTVETNGEIGLLDERSGLDPELTLCRAIRFWDQIDRFGDPNVEAVSMMGLDGLLDVPVRYLSTGQRKRAAMAVLIGSDTTIWLLDEPLSGLDTNGIELVTQRIINHLQLGRLALIASHQPLDIPGLRTLALEDYAPPLQVAE